MIIIDTIIKSANMVQYMLGRQVVNKKSYVLIGVRKDNVYHTAIYTDSNGEQEKITSIRTGEVFTDLRKFVESVRGCECYYEWSDCHYYEIETNEWFPLSYLLPRRSFL